MKAEKKKGILSVIFSVILLIAVVKKKSLEKNKRLAKSPLKKIKFSEKLP